MQFFSGNPDKRATERFWLLYTPVWGSICGVIMLGGWAQRWGDLELMILGVGLAIPVVVGPLRRRAAPAPSEPSEPSRAFWRASGFKLAASVVGLSFGLNYSQTPFFFEVLHMHFGFNARIAIQHNPLFLYFLTVPYFATYAVLCMGAYRLVMSGIDARHRVSRWALAAVAPFVMAALETFLNANPWTRSLFCYDDVVLVAWFGTLVYGTSLCLALPIWIKIDEEPGRPVPLARVFIWLAAALYADVVLLDLYRYTIAPHVTKVVPGANGLRDFGSSCLQPLPPS